MGTERMPNQVKKTCYAQRQEVNSSELKEVVNKLIPDTMADDIRKACSNIFPLKDVHVRKVKVLKKPRFDLHKLMELHGESGKVVSGDEVGTGVDRPDNYEPPV